MGVRVAHDNFDGGSFFARESETTPCNSCKCFALIRQQCPASCGDPMKRKLIDNTHVIEAKKAKLDMVVPLEGSMSLLHLAVLQKVLHNYCINLSRGLAIPESVCDYCNLNTKETKACEETVEKLVTDRLSLAEQDKYKVYVLLSELSKHGKTSRISLEDEDSSLVLRFQDLQHMSWFAIQVLLFDSPAHSVTIDLTSQTMNVSCTSKTKQKDPKSDDILREIILKYQKAVLQKK